MARRATAPKVCLKLRSLLMLETRVDPNKLVPVLHYDGLPILARSVVDGVNQDLARGKAA